jgi:hypothetical protein
MMAWHMRVNLQVEELRRRRLTDLNRARWRLAVHRITGTHQFVLDDTSAAMHRLPPRTHEARTFQHQPPPFTTRSTTLDPHNPPPTRTAIVRHVAALGVNSPSCARPHPL